jgi:hypothetical protein
MAASSVRLSYGLYVLAIARSIRFSYGYYIYCQARLDMVSKSLAIDLKLEKVSVLLERPGHVATEMTTVTAILYCIEPADTVPDQKGRS